MYLQYSDDGLTDVRIAGGAFIFSGAALSHLLVPYLNR
jgi:hypothetical protein